VYATRAIIFVIVRTSVTRSFLYTQPHRHALEQTKTETNLAGICRALNARESLWNSKLTSLACKKGYYQHFFNIVENFDWGKVS
jgi:hypothetical protein